MNHASLQILTWGTIAAAVISALLLAAAGDDGAVWRVEPLSSSARTAPMRPRGREPDARDVLQEAVGRPAGPSSSTEGR